MKILKQEKKGSRVLLEIEVEYQVFKDSYEKVLRDASSNIKIPGFRPGKAPRNIVEQNINLDIAKEKALDNVVEKNYSDILKESKIEPIDFPYWNLISSDDNKFCIFSIEVDVQPEVKLASYKGVKAPKKEQEITDKNVDDYIENLLENSAKINQIENRAVKNGDIVDLDIEGSQGNIIQDSLSQRALPILIGADKVAPGFDENIIGLNISNEKQFNIALPKDYYIKEFAGQDVSFKVRINKIYEKILPEFNDEFVNKISSFNSVAEYRADIKKRLENAAKENAEAVLKDEVLEKISSKSEVDLPESLIKKEIDAMLNELEANLSESKLTIDDYINSRKMTKDDLETELRPSALSRAKAKLVLNSIAKAEDFTISDDEIDKEIDAIAQASGRPKEDYLNDNAKSFVKDYLFRRKALDYIVENADIITK